MRVTPIGGRRLKIELTDDQEVQRWQKAEAEMRRLVPTLMKLWEMEPRFLATKKDFLELLEVGGRLVDPKVSDAGWLTERRMLVLAQVEPEKKAGRPVSRRTIVAATRLLLFAPPDRVLAMEKKWRLEAYMAQVRDQCATEAVERARSKATKDAENCVARARQMVAKAQATFFEKHPETRAYFLVAEKVVSEEMAKSGQDGAGTTRQAR